MNIELGIECELTLELDDHFQKRTYKVELTMELNDLFQTGTSIEIANYDTKQVEILTKLCRSLPAHKFQLTKGLNQKYR